jgi:hypothetical protein
MQNEGVVPSCTRQSLDNDYNVNYDKINTLQSKI